MRFFNCISTAEEKEYSLHYKLFSALPPNLKYKLMPRLPLYISGQMADMGAGDEVISGRRICIPADDRYSDTIKKLARAASKARRMRADVIVLEDKAFNNSAKLIEQRYGIRVAMGRVYPPMAFIDAAKSISGLMGIDFKRSNICIADAASDMGLIMTELLLNETAYLTLCTHDKEKINDNTEKYIKECGLSPVVVSNVKKSMEMCKILFYTGDMDLNELTSYVKGNILIVNMSQQTFKLDRDYLVIDEVILKGLKDPVANDDKTDSDTFLTSVVWEGAISAISGIDVSSFDIKRYREVGLWARRMGLSVKAVVNGDKVIDRKNVYMYR